MADNTLHSSARANWLERRFALRSRGGTLRTECLAGITGFLAAAYLLVVIPGLLAIGGMDKGAATTGTICYEGNHLILPGRDGIKREHAGLLECLVLAFDTNSREDGWFWIKFDTGALLVLSHF